MSAGDDEAIELPRDSNRTRRPSMRDDIEEPLDYPESEPEFPKTVYFAGVVWIIFGSLMLLSAVLNLVLTLGRAAGGPEAAGGICGLAIVVLFGAAFIYVGVQSTRGTATDTLGNGIGSIVIGLLNGGYSVLVLVGAAVLGGSAGLLAGILGGISLLAGTGLVVAGILALVGRAEYKEWRRAQNRRIVRR